MLGYLSKPLVIYTRYSSMTLDSLCNTCNKSVSSRNSIECNLCLTQTHFKCNNLNFVDGQVIKNANKSWFCLQCSKNIFPFTNINSYKLSLIVNSSDKQFSPASRIVLLQQSWPNMLRTKIGRFLQANCKKWFLMSS